MRSSLLTLIQDTLVYAADHTFEETSFLVSKEYAHMLTPKAPLPSQAVYDNPSSHTEQQASSNHCNVAKQDLARVASLPLQPVTRSTLKSFSPSAIRALDNHSSAAVEQSPVKPHVDKHPSPSPQIRDTLSKLIPSLRLTDTIPGDEEGQRMANLWKEKLSGTQIVLLALSQESETLELLKSLAKAIDSRFGPTKIISAKRLESQEQWHLFFKANTFRLVIASSSHPFLMSGMQTVQNTPLLLLDQPQVYKQIAKKAELWKTICHHLNN